MAILARGRDAGPEPRDELPGDPADRHSRYIEAAVSGVLVGCLYLPNGNPQPGPKFDYKLAWFERLIAHAAELLRRECRPCWPGTTTSSRPMLDIYPTKSWANNALLQPQSRARLPAAPRPGLDRRRSHAASGGADVHVLGLHAGALAAGRRPPLDHLLLSAPLASRLAAGRGRSRRARGRGGERPRAGMGQAARVMPGLDRA